ncbi:rCG46485 [Rattus norvegicus]|uniref:RCG46485 n=1 Tax=Rattus norvegicus TaxID=10116 RepID=A6IBY4_RAT|nr:rCG46485 [Rattus norvegicus]
MRLAILFERKEKLLKCAFVILHEYSASSRSLPLPP